MKTTHRTMIQITTTQPITPTTKCILYTNNKTIKFQFNDVSPCLIQLDWLTINSSQNYQQAVDPHAQRSHRKVSALSGRHDAAYVVQWHAPVCALSLKQPATSHLGWAPSFSFSSPASWNSLPTELRTISDATVFKNKLKTYLLKLSFDIQ